jgi:thiol-disulfide isomerase/thioredoxin
MLFLHIDPTNKKNTKKFNKYLKEGKNVFVLFYLEGCGPCNATRPEWKKLENVFADNDHQNIVIADIDQSVMDDLENVEVQPKGFPSMYHICKKKGICNDYEDEDLSKKDRTIDSFVEWIENHIKKSSRENLMRGGKWSLKYKRSINCRRPKGFSQRQHCKYGRKQIHTRKTKNKNKNKTKKRGM